MKVTNIHKSPTLAIGSTKVQIDLKNLYGDKLMFISKSKKLCCTYNLPNSQRCHEEFM